MSDQNDDSQPKWFQESDDIEPSKKNDLEDKKIKKENNIPHVISWFTNLNKIVIISLISLLIVVAILIGRDIKIKYHPDGKIEIEIVDH